jgi:hypothetical protein
MTHSSFVLSHLTLLLGNAPARGAANSGPGNSGAPDSHPLDGSATGSPSYRLGIAWPPGDTIMVFVAKRQ